MTVQPLKTDLSGAAVFTELDAVLAGPLSAVNLNGLLGAATANSALAMVLNNDASASVQFPAASTLAATIQFQGTLNGNDWVPVNGIQAGSSNPPTSSYVLTGGAGLYRLTPGGLAGLRVVITAYTSGTATVTMLASQTVGGIFANQTLPVGVQSLPSLPAGGNVIGATNVNTANVSATTALHTANITTGLTVGNNLPITGYGTAVLKVTGTFVATMAFKVSQDAGVSWDNISGTQVGGGDIFTSATLPGSYRFTVAGFDLLRVDVTLTSGSITINGKSSNAVNASKIVKLATSGLTIGALAAGTNNIGTVNLSKAATATVTPVPSAVTATTLLAANAARLGAAFFNDSTALLYLKWGAAPSTASYTVKVAAGQYYELPGPFVYSGIVTGVWAAANGNVLTTEVVA